VGFLSEATNRTGIDTPYSLTAILRTEKKLLDGNTISTFATSRQARDGEGRTRVDEPYICVLDRDQRPVLHAMVKVTDPVAATRTTWQDELGQAKKTATTHHDPYLARLSKPPTAQEEYRREERFSHVYDKADPALKHDSQQVEDLGQRTIAGLAASGFRVTVTSPVGMVGNSLPLTFVHEEWISDQYRIVVLEIKDDPIYGKSTYEVTSFTPGEPDASLFQPPADYEVKTQ
jgi:hypothetical protein